jgi:hypothetical protein
VKECPSKLIKDPDVRYLSSFWKKRIKIHSLKQNINI